MFKQFALMLVAVVTFTTNAANADTLYGKIVNKNGDKVKKTARISTSWNSETATYLADGEYKIDFKGKVGSKITVYVNGDKYTTIEVKGDTKLDIKLKK